MVPLAPESVAQHTVKRAPGKVKRYFRDGPLVLTQELICGRRYAKLFFTGSGPPGTKSCSVTQHAVKWRVCSKVKGYYGTSPRNDLAS